jgi:hypothetical protein
MQQRFQYNSSFFRRKGFVPFKAPGNEVDAARLLPVGQVAPGDFKRGHGLEACATGIIF